MKLYGVLSSPAGLNGALTVPRIISPDIYDGGYTFTPADEAQTVSTGGKVALEDITINPIPGNYGRLEYTGSYLRVY